ncbi:MAG TPA: tetratricopeptide repeat protein [Bradyrhizobium sp.]|uniref:tetratricopeptide repeat protein n=1 Tax=Bradyrhizobium sp. TaxID=376 RepID=UPI002CCAB050|nr:tetratricopeptide repeat protein [Bradyrhizobium sp.]HTB01772.1 tetratricopeptide repeat protein [Bradyrhizobium sp.]
MVSALATRLSGTETADAQAAQDLQTGLAHYAAGRIIEAIGAYRHGLALSELEPSGLVSVETLAKLHANLGNACMVRGDLEFAAENYKAALRLSPHLTACWCNLGNVRLKTGKAGEAIALYAQALTINPAHWPSRTNLAQALMATQQHLLARALLTELIGERPQEAQLHHQLGKLLFELNELQAALESFRRAAVLNPGDADTIYWIGGICQQLGEIDAAEAAYARAAQLQPLIRRPAAKFPADFRILALYAPFAGNLPTGYLFKQADYDTDTLALFASSEIDVELLKRDVQVVVNLISDADQGAALLPLAADLAARLGKPIVNDPLKIRRTTRDAIAELLQGIPGCRVPKISRLKAGTDLAAALQGAFAASPSVLVRPAGTHGGDDFERIEGAAELEALLAQRPGCDHYLIEYIDYRSADGYFRKYRFIFVNGEILPYHLAIADGWKVHHDSTDMADHPWMQREEEAFLGDPAGVFNPSHYLILREIRRRIGLDYFGIDCGLDVCGNLVVFEANASMLVHEQNEDFPYKAPFVLRIKSAFDAMLRKFAMG